MELYNILEILPNASDIEIKNAYRKLAKIYHPDKNNGTIESKEKFQKLTAAYEILINEKYRHEYYKMDETKKINFLDILNKIIKGITTEQPIDVEEIKNMIDLNKTDYEYLKTNYINFFNKININELFSFFKNNIVKNKYYDEIDCSETDVEYYDETYCSYYYNLPISYHKINNLDIRLEFNIKLNEISNKREIKIKRNINSNTTITTFVFNLNNPYIVYINAGDMKDDEYGNLIIKLVLPNNIIWDNDLILMEKKISLHEFIYGLQMNNILWLPSRDGLIVYDTDNKILATKLCLDYTSTPEKENIIKTF